MAAGDWPPVLCTNKVDRNNDLFPQLPILQENEVASFNSKKHECQNIISLLFFPGHDTRGTAVDFWGPFLVLFSPTVPLR